MSLSYGVVQFPGSCDERDAVEACERVEGAQAQLLWHGDEDLHGVDAVVVPGGFSYGDHLRAGAIARLSPIMRAVEGFAREGGPVLGICNGFQVLCEAGLLPGALLPNTAPRFVCRQVELEVVDAETAWTRGTAVGDRLSIPAKHMTGRFWAPDAVLDETRVVLRYTQDPRPNGSSRAIAGVANAAGNVVGLMPHPEHAVSLLHGGSTDGLKLLASAA